MTTPQQIMQCIRAEIEQRRHDSGMSGSWSDGGASVLEQQLEVYISAIQGAVPKTWQGIVERWTLKTDHEYNEYLRLNEKFKGRLP